MTIRLAILWLLFAGVAYAHDYPEEHTHGFFVPSAGEPPIVEPPPVEPPPVDPPPVGPGDSLAHFLEQCAKPDVIACRSMADRESVITSAYRGAVVPSTPSDPITNRKCRWNDGVEDCFPMFEGGDCSELDPLLQNPGRAQTDSILRASLWAPCFHEESRSARLTYWNDRKRGIQTLYADDGTETRVPNVSAIWTQFEINLPEAIFFEPYGSRTAKLTRVHREKDPFCSDDRAFDHRWYLSQESITLSVTTYCDYPTLPPSQDVQIERARAGHWFRVTTALSLEADTVRLWVYDLTADEDLTAPPAAGVRWTTSSDQLTLDFWRVLLHSSSHQPNETWPSPNFYMRHFIISQGAIDR